MEDKAVTEWRCSLCDPSYQAPEHHDESQIWDMRGCREQLDQPLTRPSGDWYRCPKRVMNSHQEWILDFFDWKFTGILPYPGEWGDQPLEVLEIFRLLEAGLMEGRQAKIEQDRAANDDK